MSKWRRGSQRERLHQVSEVPKSERAGDRTNLGGAYWARGKEWNYTSAALQGSSFYKLPKILQWFTGNIGFHHIHHLSPRIANYHLERCHEADPYFKRIKPVTFLTSFKSLTYRLWDEQRQRFVGFRHLKGGQMESGPIRVLGCDLRPGDIDVSFGRWVLRTKSARCS
jgi:hypothetical protein